MSEHAGTFLIVWEYSGDPTIATAACEDRVHSAVSAYLVSDRDTIIELDRLAGDVYFTLASNIASWGVSTPEARTAQAEHEKLMRDERTATRQALGIWEPEEDE